MTQKNRMNPSRYDFFGFPPFVGLEVVDQRGKGCPVLIARKSLVWIARDLFQIGQRQRLGLSGVALTETCEKPVFEPFSARVSEEIANHH